MQAPRSARGVHGLYAGRSSGGLAETIGSKARFGLIRRCLSTNPRGLYARVELAPHFAPDARGQDSFHLGQKTLDGWPITLGQDTQRPRKRLDHHILAIACQAAANRKGPDRISRAAR